MTITVSPIFSASIPVFKQLLGGLAQVLAKAADHVEAKKLDPNALLQARLYPDMFALLRQVQVASDFAKSVSARLAGVDVPKFEDDELTFADLQARITAVLTFIEGLTLPNLTKPQPAKSSLRRAQLKKSVSRGSLTCSITACRTSFFIPPRPMRSCGTTALKSVKKILSARIEQARCVMTAATR